MISEKDFVEDFHKIVFGSIYNIHMSSGGVSIDSIIDYLSNRPKFEGIFKANKGVEYLQEVSQQAKEETFNYYYTRLKKFSLLRAYENVGIDISYLYDPSEIIDVKKRQKQEDWLDSTSLIEIADIIDKRIEDIRYKYVEDDFSVGY